MTYGVHETSTRIAKLEQEIFPGHEPQHIAEAIVTRLALGWRVGSGLSAPPPERHEPARPPRRARLLSRLGR